MKNQSTKKRSIGYLRRLQARIALNKKAFIIYTILRILVILTAVRCLFTHNYESLALCILSLILFLLPSFFEEQFKIAIPPLFQTIIYCFIYAAEILGEVNQYYTAIHGWDTMLHTLNGFLCAALGFSLVELLNRNRKGITLSPFYLAVMGFCFSMTVGVLWEFFEFSIDQFLHFDMQKDFVVTEIASVTLDSTNSQIPVRITNIVNTVVETADGAKYTISGGYLDLGIIDTMKDLFVNFIGAVVFSIIGFIYARSQGKNKRSAKIADDLLWHALSEEEYASQENEIDKKMHKERKHS